MSEERHDDEKGFDARAVAARIGRALNRRGYFVMIVVAVFSISVKEWLPFSRSAMYSRPQDDVSYFYVSDLDDTPIPTSPELGIRCSRLRKAFHAFRAREEGPAEIRERRAGELTLRYAVDRNRERAKRSGYRLWRVDVRIGECGVTRDERVVAEWP